MVNRGLTAPPYHALEEPVEALPRALIRVRNDHVVRILQLRQSVQQQRDAAFEARQGLIAEVEALLQRVDVEDQRAAGRGLHSSTFRVNFLWDTLGSRAWTRGGRGGMGGMDEFS